MDALGFVLIVAGALVVAEQVFSLFAWLIVCTAMSGKMTSTTVSYYPGRVGILLVVAGVLVRYFL